MLPGGVSKHLLANLRASRLGVTESVTARHAASAVGARERPRQRARVGLGLHDDERYEPAKPRRGRREAERPRAPPYTPAAATLAPASSERSLTWEGVTVGDAAADAVNLDFVFEVGEGIAPEEPASASDGGRSNAAAADFQRRLARARNAGQVLEVAASGLDAMDATHAVTALHRLARHALGGQRGAAALGGHPVVEALLDRLGKPAAAADGSSSISGLSAQSLCCLLLAVAKLHVSPPWLPKLLGSCGTAVPTFSSHQLATAVHALTKLEGLPAAREAQTSLLEALHQELLRRRAAFGPGGSSALDAVLVADGLARLQIRDDQLLGSLAAGLSLHLQAGALQAREVRHVATAFASLGMADAKLSAALCAWLAPRVAASGTADLVMLAWALARVGHVAPAEHAALFAALRPEVLARARARELAAPEAARLLYAFDQAVGIGAGGADSDALVDALAVAVGRSPQGLNGQDLALLVPSLGAGIKRHPALLAALEAQTARCANKLSPRQLARLACGFGDAAARSPGLWAALTGEALSRAAFFAAPDVLRALAGFDAAGVSEPGVLRALWGAVDAKGSKFLAEESLALLQLWPGLAPSLQRERSDLPGRLLGNLGERLERGSRGGWRAPPELATELLEWLPRSRALHSDGHLDARVVRAALNQLPDQLATATPATWPRLLAALTLADGELLARVRGEVQRQEALRRAFEKHVAPLPQLQLTHDAAAAAAVAFRCAALGLDGAAVKQLLRELLLHVADDIGKGGTPGAAAAVAAQLCWACAEVKAHAVVARRLASQVALSAGDTDDAAATEDGAGGVSTDEATLSWIRLAWASLAMGGDDAEVGALAARAGAAGGDGVLHALTAADVRPARQLAWHVRNQHDAALPDESVRWTEVVLAREPWGSYDAAAGRRLSELLQHMRVPHVASSPLVLPGGIYRVPAWFPQPGAVLDIDARGDRLASGASSGASELRRKQLRSRGLRVLTLSDATVALLQGEGERTAARGAERLPPSERRTQRSLRLRAVAEVVAEVCPEAAAWLRSAEAAAIVATAVHRDEADA